MIETMFKTWFTDAVASTFVVAVILAVSGGVCAFLLRRNAEQRSVSTRRRCPRDSRVEVPVAQSGDA